MPRVLKYVLSLQCKVNQFKPNIMESNVDFNFDEFYSKHQKSCYYRVYKNIKCYGNKYDADEIVNDCFLKLKRLVDTGVYDSDKSKYITYLYKIMDCAIIDVARNFKVCGSVYFEVDDINCLNNYEDAYSRPIDKYMDDKDTNRIINVALTKLKPKAREIIELFYFDGLKYDEIAKILNISLNSVKVNIFRAKEELSKVLAGKQAFI